MWMTIILIESNEFNIFQADGHCIRMVTSGSTKTCQIYGILSLIFLLVLFSHRLQAFLFYIIFTVITYFIFQFAWHVL
jgi:hypothetical protein